MSDSTIEDALKLLETGKGNLERLKRIIESFERKSMISMQDRKYIDALVEQYLTPRHRQAKKKIDPFIKQETKFPRIRKTTESSFKITEVKTTSENSYVKPSTSREISQHSANEDLQQNISNSCSKCGSKILDNNEYCINCGTKIITAPQKKEEVVSKESTIEEKFIEHIETDRSITKKSSNGKLVGIIIGVIAVIIIGGGAAYIGSSSDLFAMNTEIEERITCENNILLVSYTKIPNFPAPGKDLEYYQDRYDNEPKYKEWFDNSFPEQTIREVLLPQVGDKETVVPGFPDPEKDLQHYLDRYNNEPKYKEWFDNSFPEQTIRQAVC